jgi:precorrin-2 dehydrogenase/sirohydrochlorin ferrochelatase/precorrin-6A/cobalt-precorrin-6A reductase
MLKLQDLKEGEGKMPNLLIFAGTTEGRELLEALSGSIEGSDLTVHACVATDYGRELLPSGLGNIIVRSGRMTEDEMTAFMQENQFDCVIDTTHPYARLVSENIRAACLRAGCEYIRLLRESGVRKQMDCLFFGSNEEVAAYLDQTEGNVLLTIGSKELSKYTKIRDFQKRIFPRVLPMPEVVESCYILGFPGKQLICMQGPFTARLNIAMIEQICARYLVTKDSGETGGFYDKYQAAQATGATLLVVGREKEEAGRSPDSVVEFLENTYHIRLSQMKAVASGQPEEEPGQWFPLFIDVSKKTFVIIGAGRIAERRIRTLLKFRCRIRVIAKEATEQVTALAAENKMDLRIGAFETTDLAGADYVLAATDDRLLNHEIWKLCKTGDIPVNVVDDKEKSDFYFPGVVRKKGVTVGVTAEGKDHSLARKATAAIADCLDRNLQEDTRIGNNEN